MSIYKKQGVNGVGNTDAWKRDQTNKELDALSNQGNQTFFVNTHTQAFAQSRKHIRNPKDNRVRFKSFAEFSMPPEKDE